uniref:Amino acid transporter transmembrane domain-containing protein n=1 Tax=Oryza barthii TaxID=65489 RepID=A0A0D3HB62_9ORYZ
MASGSSGGGYADEKGPGAATMQALGLQQQHGGGGEVEEESSEMGEKTAARTRLSGLLWHGGSAYDAWFSCASNQVAQVLLTLPYSFAQLGMASGILFQLFYGLLGSWTAYLISILYLEYRTRKERDKVDFRNHVLDGLLGRHWRNVGLAFNCTFLLFGSVIQLIGCASNIYYINDHLDKRTWTYIFGACCATTVFIPSFHNYRIWSFLGLLMTTYTAWYIAVASLIHGQVEGVAHSGPTSIVLYFTGATNILYTFGGHAVTKFKAIYLLATVYVLTLTLPSASAAYWAFGDALLTHSNALALLPRTPWRDAAVVLMLIHQFITFGFACTPLYFVWEKLVGLHGCPSLCKRAAARLPVVLPIWFLAIIFPFFGPINSAVGSLLVSFTRPPRFAGGWTGAYVINSFVVAWVLVVGFGFGGWASITNFVHQVDTFRPLAAGCHRSGAGLDAAAVQLHRRRHLCRSGAVSCSGSGTDAFRPWSPPPSPAPPPRPLAN